MYNLTYLSTDDLERLIEIDDELPSTRGTPEHDVLLQERASIESRRKPMIECNMDECLELRDQIFKKLQRLSSIGKTGIAQQFKVMYDQVSGRIMELTVQTGVEEKKKMEQLKKDQKEKRRRRFRKDEDSKPKVKLRSGLSRWTTGITKPD
jgi:hypothetical protein